MCWPERLSSLVKTKYFLNESVRRVSSGNYIVPLSFLQCGFGLGEVVSGEKKYLHLCS